jgi:hypothetical protein
MVEKDQSLDSSKDYITNVIFYLIKKGQQQ